MDAAVTDSLVGTVVAERYLVRALLMGGRYSSLYRCIDQSSGAPVVLRILHTSGLSADTLRAARVRFTQEAHALHHLTHRNLPRVLDSGAEDGCFYLALEPFEGNRLSYVVKHLPGLPAEPLLVRWMEQVAAALDCLHSMNIVYCDLRPQSIVLTSNGVVKLVDAGMARFVEDLGADIPTLSVFAAPEQAAANAHAAAMDLYALGATFYFLATGVIPTQPLLQIRERNPQVSASFEALIGGLMEVDPAARPASAAEVTRRLAPQRAEPMPPTTAVEQDGSPSPFKDPSLPTTPLPPPDEASAKKWRAPLEFLWPTKKKRASTPRLLPSDDIDMPSVPFVDLSTIVLEREVGRFIPRSIAKRVQGVCIARAESSPAGATAAVKEITLAVKTPDVYIYDHINYTTGGAYKPILMRADPKLVDLAYEYIYKLSPTIQHVPWLEWLEKKRFHGQDLSLIHNEDQQALLQMEDVRGPAVETVDRMIKEAISIRASDIHIETYENEVSLRYRIDGILHVMDTWPRREAAAFIKRIKILSNMDIAQDMMPQGGRISVRVSDQEFDLRVSCVPVPDGESIVMRLLNKGTFTMRLQDLGFSEDLLVIYRRLIDQPHGMLLISGPTGSGKSTTLYATLAEINRPDRKILTVEDPIEYKMQGVVQVQVNISAREDEKRLTFAKALREFLRQDPDVILVGEIRDDETAAVAVEAALTGHLLLSTIHTNDAVGIITRLRDRNVETFLISSVLLGGIAQRLVRRICQNCREEVAVPPAVARLLESEKLSVSRLMVGRGCLQCHRTGYRGRVALYEILEINPELAELIAANATSAEIQAAAQRQGFRTLLQRGLERVADGTATFEEVKRVCMTV